MFALGLLTVFRPGNAGKPHRAIEEPAQCALYAALMLGCRTFGVAIILNEVLG